MDEFEGKVILITGAGKGYGRALAEAFAKLGAIVIANDLTPINLDDTISRIQSAGGCVQAYVADIASKLALQTMLNTILDEHGRIDCLINTINISPTDALLAMDEWDWRRAIDLNLTGPFLLMQSVGRIMQSQGDGAIIHLIAVEQNSPVALAGKSGLIGLTQAAGSEFGVHHIRINAVCVGFPGAERVADLPADPVDLVIFLCREKSAGFQGRVLQAKA
jgi:NAD(P)-dependent dehydrogenase (short-subunit alcohol dehydrogenase family)